MQIGHSAELQSIIAENDPVWGDCEADTILGKTGGAILVKLVERKTHFGFYNTPDKSTNEVIEAMLESLLPLVDYVHTFTNDNNKE